MQDFNFQNDTRIVFGRDKVDSLGEEAKRYGKKALLVHGRESIKKSGLYDRVRTSLATAGLDTVDHGGVKSNPLLSHTRKGVEKAKAHGVEVVVAVGGGSAMDEAKGIAAGAATEHDVWEFFTGGGRVEAALPLITVPTLAATGSEMNGNTVITDDATRQKLAIYSPSLLPKVSVLDPQLTATVPWDYTVYGIVDVFSHIMEPYFNGKETNAPVQDRLAEGLMLSLFEIAEVLMSGPSGYHARADLLWASTVALNGTLAMGRGGAPFENHLIAHALGALFDAPHGAALSVVMPGWMAFSAPRKPEIFARFTRRVMDADTPERGIEKLKQWFASIESPVTLGQLGIGEKNIPDIARKVLETAPMMGIDDLKEKEVITILRFCL